MENSHTVLNKFITEKKLKSLLYNSNIIRFFIFLTSFIFILSAFLIRFQDNTLSYTSSSSVLLATIMIFTISMSYIPLYVSSSTNTNYFFIFGFILQIINIVLYGELLTDNNNNGLFISMLILQLMVVSLIQYEFVR